MTPVAFDALTDGQRRTIDGCAEVLRMDAATVSALARDAVGVGRIDALMSVQADHVINALLSRVRARPARASREVAR